MTIPMYCTIYLDASNLVDCSRKVCMGTVELFVNEIAF